MSTRLVVPRPFISKQISPQKAIFCDQAGTIV